jgi:hypothetical protein
MRTDISAETDHFVPFGDEVLSIDCETAPIPTERFEQTFNDRLRPMPGSAVVWKPLRLGPLDLRIKEREDGGDVAAPESIVEAANAG